MTKDKKRRAWSRESALVRFEEEYGDLAIAKIETFGNGREYETEITIKRQTITYGDTWDTYKEKKS